MTPLKFCFKGSRQYVHGTDIVAQLLAFGAQKSLSEIDIKFNGIATQGLDLVEGTHVKDAKVNIRWQENDELKTYQLIENGESIDCRYEYDEEALCDNAELDLEAKTITLQQPTGYTLCENFVALNKYLLQGLFPDEKGKWYFTRLEQAELIDDDSLIEVRFIKNFNFRLTKSEIRLGDKVVGSVYFSMVKEAT